MRNLGFRFSCRRPTEKIRPSKSSFVLWSVGISLLYFKRAKLVVFRDSEDGGGKIRYTAVRRRNGYT